MPYTKTTWTNASTALSAANMSNIENGVAAAVTTNGDTGMTAALPITVTMSGADKVFLDLTATDGKHWQIREAVVNGPGALYIYNVTDGVVVALFPPTGAAMLTANQVPAPAYIGQLSSRPAAGNKYRLAFITPFA